ncbi:MAG TPA: MDR family MFS transporter [Paenirhodobacter sp.]
MIFCFLLMGMFMSTLDNQIVSTALPTIIGEFGALERFGWISSAYLLAQSTIMPVYGKLGDLFGRKYVMITAVVLFTTGSLACGMAWSMDSLIAARVLQGLGAGGIMVSIFSINADLFVPRERARYQSFSSLVLMASGSVGPAIGGGLSQTFGWRSIFLVNLPVGVIVVLALLILLPHWRPHRKPRIDYAGAVTLAVAVAGVVLWADSQSIFGSLLAPGALMLLAISAVAAVVWVRIERHAPEPIIPLALFRDRNFGLLLIVALASGAIAIGMVNYHALFLQMTTGLSAARAGLFFIAVSGGIAIGSLTAGRLIERTGRYKPWMVLGYCVSILCLGGLVLVPLGTPFWVLAGLLLGRGIAIGLAQQGPVIGVQTSAPERDIGAATGSVTLSRMAGASLMISVYGAILSNLLAHKMIEGAGALATLTPAEIAALPPASAHAVAVAYRAAFVDIYLMAAATAAVALIAALALKPVVLAAQKQPDPAVTEV